MPGVMTFRETVPGGPEWSLVVPFFNEAAGLTAFLLEVHSALGDFCKGGVTEKFPPYEVLLVDDGSTDNTCALLAQACEQRMGWRVVSLSQNCGQAAALYTGMIMATGRYLILLDGDGQNDPQDIARVAAAVEAGADLAVGVRAQRQDDWRRRIMSRLANAVRRRLLRDGVSDTGCGLKVLRREVVVALVPIRTLYSFIPALAAGAGFRVAEVVVSHRQRNGGKSNYGVRRFLVWPLVDMLGVWWLIHRRCPAACRVPVNPGVSPPSSPVWLKT